MRSIYQDELIRTDSILFGLEGSAQSRYAWAEYPENDDDVPGRSTFPYRDLDSDLRQALVTVFKSSGTLLLNSRSWQ